MYNLKKKKTIKIGLKGKWLKSRKKIVDKDMWEKNPHTLNISNTAAREVMLEVFSQINVRALL